MTQVKNKISKAGILVLLASIIVSFNYKPFAFDGGSITNPNIVITANTTPPKITATNASGCGGVITYQWQQSFDASNFMDVPNATDTSFQAGLIINTTHFRRRAICSGTDTAYTTNIAIVIVQ